MEGYQEKEQRKREMEGYDLLSASDKVIKNPQHYHTM